MTTIRLPTEFKEFFQLLNNHGVEYLLIGGYAISYYGFPRATGDMDIWVSTLPKNQVKLIRTLQDFGIKLKTESDNHLLKEGEFIRIGNPPLRIELVTKISGVSFETCHKRKNEITLEGIKIPLIGLEDLKQNKRMAGRHKDLNDLENLPEK